MSQYQHGEFSQRIRSAKDLPSLVLIAKEMLEKMPRPRVQICGPISTGSTKTVQENINYLERSILLFESNKINIFNQLLFEPQFNKIANWKPTKEYSDMPILEEFYGKIFESKLIDKIYFLPGWEKSFGAQWEYNCAKKFKIERITLDVQWEDNVFLTR